MANIISILIEAKDSASATLKSLGVATNDVGEQSKSATGSFGGLISQFAAGQLIADAAEKGFSLLSSQVSSAKTAADAEQQSLAQLNAVLESTHGSAGVTAAAAEELAESIQKTTPVSKEAATSAEDMLLTFTNIGKDQFGGATKAVVDMATAMNGGATPAADQLKDTAIQVGKALNDPAIGLTALQRVGVSFTDQQKTMIEQWEATGHTAEAQTYIINELNREFGGSGAAALTTYQGKMEQMKNTMDEAKAKIAETVETAVAPLAASLANFVSGDTFNAWVNDAIKAITTLAQDLVDATKFYEAHKRAINDVAQVVLALVAGFLILATTIKTINTVTAIWNALAETNPWVLALTAIIAVILLVVTHWQQISAVATQVWNDVTKATGQAVSAVTGFAMRMYNDVAGFFTAIGTAATNIWNSIYSAAATVFSAIYNVAIKPVLDLIMAYFNVVWTVYSYIFDVMRGLAIVTWNYIYTNVIKPILDLLVSDFNFYAGVVTAAWNLISAAAVSAWNFIYNVAIHPIIQAIMFEVNGMMVIVTTAWNIISAVGTAVWGAVSGAASAAWGYVVGVWGGAANWFSGIWNGIVKGAQGIGGGIASAVTGAFDGAKNIIVGAVNWIIDKINGVIGAINNTAGKLPGVPKIGTIPHLATGGLISQGGMAIVGEQGQEAVFLPQGAQVVPARQTKQLLNGGGGHTFNIQVPVATGSAADRQSYAVSIAQEITKALRAQGLDQTQMGNLR